MNRVKDRVMTRDQKDSYKSKNCDISSKNLLWKLVGFSLNRSR